MVPWHLQPKYQEGKKLPTESTGSAKDDQLHKLGYCTYHRYYHLFKKGELSELFKLSNQQVDIIEEYYDHENWCVVAKKQ